MVTLLPRQRMQRCGEVCHSVFALSVFASRLRGRGCFDQHFILPARRHPLPPLHTFEPHHIRPTHQIIFLRQGVGAAGRAAQARVEHAPPVPACPPRPDVQPHRVVPPGGQSPAVIAPGGKVHIHEIHPHRGADALCGQRPLRRQLKLQKPPCNPRPRLRCTLRRALLHHGKHRIPHPELGALVSYGIAGRPDVQPQGVGAQRCPGIQLGAPPVQPLQSAAQHKARQQAGAQQPHLPDRKRF